MTEFRHLTEDMEKCVVSLERARGQQYEAIEDTLKLMDVCAKEMEERQHVEKNEEKVRDQKIEELMDLQEKMSESINKLLKEANKPQVYIYKRVKQADQIPEAKKERF